jgi:FAD/FMN-containing dehydrogenase/Fe-S oxidoreductase
MTTADIRELLAELRQAGIEEVDDSRRRRAEYSSDASNYRAVPKVVIFPQHVEEVQAALKVAASAGTTLTARGGGTSTAGNSVGGGIVIDFSRHLNRVLSVDPDTRTATVEPGTVLDAITHAARPYDLCYGPDPSTHARATIGGSIGNNSCGARALTFGRSADNVVSLDVLTGDGIRFNAGRYGLDGFRSAGTAGDRPEAGLLTGLDALVQERAAPLSSEFGRFTRQVSGYSVEHLLPRGGVNLGRFLAGTEGTLAIILGATVDLVKPPAAVALAVLGYPDMATAAESVPALLPHRPVALEGMDARLVEVVRSRRGAAAVPELPRGGGWLFIETAGDSVSEARAAAEKLVADADCLDSAIVTGAAASALWAIREDGAGLGSRTPKGEPAWPGWEDAAVPPPRLGAYLREFSDLLSDHNLDGLTYGHFGEGCVHARINFPLATKPGEFRSFLVEAAQLVAGHGGSMSGEHGDGRARGELLRYMYSADAIRLFGEIKRLFDGRNVLNPGVIVDPVLVDADLRIAAARPMRKGLGFAYAHDGGDLSTAVHRCVGIGKCRAATGGVMCPSYLATRDEKDSTRGRARVLQEAANGGLIEGLRSDEVLESLDLCLSCKGCSSDCPTGVDMATYKAEVLHQRYRGRLRPMAHYTLGWLPRWAKLTVRWPRLVNAVLQQPVLARVAKRLGGIDARRPLPAFATESFRDWFTSHRSERSAGEPVLLWVDTFTEHFSPEVGRAAVRVLEAAGYAVELTERRVCCGLTWISTGQLDGARRQLRETLTALEPALEAGIPIVGMEPSCIAVLRSDATELLPDDPRAESARGAAVTLAELLTRTPTWKTPSLEGVQAVAQPHCHHHAVMGWETDAALLTDAGASVQTVGGCCGMAGNFGVERGHFEVSQAVAETQLLPAIGTAPEGAIILADGFSCRTQLDQLAGVSGIHLAELLADRLAIDS